MSPQYGELRSTSGWDRFGSLGHPSYFQPLPRLGSVIAQQSSSERQPNFAAVNRRRHLCSEGRPSRWALAHISSYLLRSAISGRSSNPLIAFPLRASDLAFPDRCARLKITYTYLLIYLLAYIQPSPHYACLPVNQLCVKYFDRTRMWANAQRDGRPAEYRWRPLFNAAKFGWCPLLGCRAVTLPRRETRWNLQGCRAPNSRTDLSR